MSKTNGVNEAKVRSAQRQILFFKDQDEFVKALREEGDASEGIGITEKAATKN